MDLSSDTRNQHFISQAEQRLNAANAEAESDRQRIFSFRVHDRESYDVRLESRRGRLISGNLSLHDLFTFDVATDHGSRFNFEVLFQRFEREIVATTASLLEKLAAGGRDIGGEIGGLFVAKLLNFARNPFSIAKILNTFGDLANYQPTAPAAARLFERVLNGRKPHQARLCAELGISDADYERWLRMLFMLFVEGDGGLSLHEATVKSLFERKSHAAAVLVCTYSEARCLLSDRSFSQITDRPNWVGLEFNLRRNAFIRYLFADHGELVPHAPREWRERYETTKHPPTVWHLKDDFECLRGFNRNAIYQCHSRVYCSARHGVMV
ncbi:hypothetical protein [Paraburkholderia hospita]|uniref:hypothetical protein n=1 Tax=Paraburkholderia hospita TaxID=169430 RepID=UPI000B348CC8|nr:hypothetical protein [Paraburkholderia hospita]OUL80383.1 hypothetical protein CA603_31490 [Paraburkholderia hospita]